MQLSQEQLGVMADVMNPDYQVAILTGAAGTGKSTIIRELLELGNVSVCATTGRAAMNVGGVTVDKVFGIDRVKWQLFNRGYTDWAMNKLNDTILIDEASMIGEKMARLLYDTANSYKKRLILVGDWGQASPVKESWAFDTPLFQHAKFTKLTECHRQSPGDYLTALNKLRLGIVDDSVDKVFRGTVDPTMPDRDFDGVCLFATNQRTDTYNNTCLEEHMAATGHWAVTSTCTVNDLRDSDKQRKQPLQLRDQERMIDDSNLLHGDRLAIGCKIVCTRNKPNCNCIDDVGSTAYVNGTTGIIEEIIFKDGRYLSKVQNELDTEQGDISVVMVRKFDGVLIPVSAIGLEVKDAADRVQYVVHGLPIKLGYGMTFHKCQGATVSNAWVDMESLSRFPKGSRHGMAYVALSRTRELTGLRLGAWLPDLVECDEVTKRWL